MSVYNLRGIPNRWNMVLTGFGCVVLYISYYSFGQPSWVDSINVDFLKISDEQKDVHVLFTVELCTWALVFFTQLLIFAKMGSNKLEEANFNSKANLILLDVLLPVLVLGYHMAMVFNGGEKALPRLFYGVFSFIVVRQLIDNFLCVYFIFGKSLQNTVEILNTQSSQLLQIGRLMKGQTTLIVLISFLSFSSFIVWSPTLLSDGLSPKYIAIGMATVVVLGSIVLTYYVQAKISSALDDGLRPLEVAITESSLAVPSSKDDVDKIKGLLEIRDKIRKSVGLPMSAIFLNILQVSGVIIAMLSTLLKFT